MSNTRRPSLVALLPAALALSVPHPSARADPPAPIAAKALLRISGSKAQVEASKAQLCARPELACTNDPSQLTLYRTADSPNAVWGILATGPVLVKALHGAGSDWTVQRRWDFSRYVHSRAKLVGPSPQPGAPPVYLYPALYPVGPSAWAVAVVATHSESYSGGDGTFAMADFVVLGDALDAGEAPMTPLYLGVPFSCSKEIRACFTEDDYKRRGNNCQDRFEGTLTLEYAPPAPASAGAQDRYAWTAVWHEVDGGGRQVTKLPPAGGDVWCTTHFDFCEGLADDDDPCPR